MRKARNNVQAMWGYMRANWRNALASHVLGTLIAYVLLTPLASLLLNVAVSRSGSAALSDQEILFFVLSPFGLASMVLLAAIAITIIVFKHAALMTIIEASSRGQQISTLQALSFIARRSTHILRLGIFMVLRVLLYVLPLLAFSWLVFRLLLSGHDINYYLAEKPAAFWFAGLLIGCCAALVGFLILRMLIGWIYSLPLVLFENSAARPALALSQQTAHGTIRQISGWLVAWILLDTVLLGGAIAATTWLGVQLVPLAVDSIGLLVLTLGAVLLCGGLLALFATFLSAVWFCAIVLQLYRDAGLQAGRGALEIRDSAAPRPWYKLRWVFAGGLVALLVAAGSSKLLLDRLTLEDDTQIIAHRGASNVAPENTMAAIEEALRQGTDWVEIDVQESADGDIVVIHDRDLKRVSGSDLEVYSSTLEQLQTVDIGSWFAPRFSDQRIPTLAQVLRACQGRAKVLIELKYYRHQQQLEERVAAVVEEAGMQQDIVIMSLSYAGISRMREVRPEWKTGLLSSVSAGKLSGLDLDFYAINAGFASRHMVRSAHTLRRKVLVWTINDNVGMSQMMSRGVDGIITNEPALARSVLEQRAKLGSAQRMLVELATLFGHKIRYLEQ